MKHLKKFCLFIILPLLLISCTFINASAKKQNELLSPALSVIAGELQLKKCGLSGNELSFLSADFENYFNTQNIQSITVTSLPAEYEARLFLADAPVIANQTIHKSDIDLLKLVPQSTNTPSSAFYFSSSALSVENSIECTAYFLPELNTPPTITTQTMGGQEISTIKNIMVYSKLEATDAENDFLTFEITTPAEHGIVSVINIQNGEYSYTPSLNYCGSDKFEYVVYDEYGNRSQSAWIEIEITDNEKSVFFHDMIEHEQHVDAIKAASYNIMSGTLVDGKSCFSPEYTPTKAEFVSMALKASGSFGKIYVSDTAFADDGDIPANLKGYVAYAANTGIISGTKTEQGVFFYPNSPITKSEAAVIINNVLGKDGYKEKTVFNDLADIPSWAEDDIMTLAEMNVIQANKDGSILPNEYITNVSAASMLVKVFEIKNDI